MIRCLLAIVLLVTAVGVTAGEDKDSIKEKLFAAKVAYDKDMRQFRKHAEEWFDKREETARKSGDKKLLDQVKEDRKSYDETGELPKSAPVALKQKHDRARKALETAYAEAVKAYIRAKKDDQAAAVEEAWREFKAKEGGAVDLFALVDPKIHTAVGGWKKDGKALIGTQSGDKGPHIQLPYEPGEEYDLEVTCRRVQGDDGIGLGVVAGGRQVLIFVDGNPPRGYETGVKWVDEKEFVAFKGPLLKADKDHTITCSVRTGKIDLLVNGKAITCFKGDFDHLSYLYPPPNKKALFLWVAGVKCSFQFNRIVVRPVKGKGIILK